MLKGLATVLMLIVSNVLMTLAWYGNLKFDFGKVFPKWGIFGIIIVSWGIALFEYLIQVPANRIGYTVYSLPQLKIIQEVISLTVFTLIVTFVFKGEPIHWNHFAAFLCLIAAVIFCFWK